jgi:hypothetical protein
MRVCLISTTQPSTNPRLVKEADALVEAGASVHVIGAHTSTWADKWDPSLLARRGWTCELLDWRCERNPVLFWKSRIRHYAAKRLAIIPAAAFLVAEAAASRIGPDLRRLAMTADADLFIAHNLGALPVALAAGDRCGAPVGFDAEDFHSGQLAPFAEPALFRATRHVEALIPRCAYVTAASPGIAKAYADLCHIPTPTCVLNVFPKRDRPVALRPADRSGPVRLHWFSRTIGPDRGLEDAVRALGLLSAYRVELHLRGEWWGNYEADLRRLAADCGVDQARIVAHEPASPDDLVRLAASYDVGLALEPSVSVNNDIALSNKLFTYVLAGNAIVATQTSGQVRLKSDLAAAAAWCHAGNAESLAAALRPWLDDWNALDTARRTAWKLGETRFNWEIEQRTFLAVALGALRAATSEHPDRRAHLGAHVAAPPGQSSSTRRHAI